MRGHTLLWRVWTHARYLDFGFSLITGLNLDPFMIGGGGGAFSTLLGFSTFLAFFTFVTFFLVAAFGGIRASRTSVMEIRRLRALVGSLLNKGSVSAFPVTWVMRDLLTP